MPKQKKEKHGENKNQAKPRDEKSSENKLPAKPVLRLLNSITLSNLWLSILSLAKKEPVYAYTLPDAISKKFGFKPSLLLVYLVLYRLEGEGLLASKEDGQRKYYSLTPFGGKTLEEGKKLLTRRAGEL